MTWKLADYECPEHGRFESLDKGMPRSVPCKTCGERSARLMSAPKPRIVTAKVFAARTGPPDDPPPGSRSYRKLADKRS